MSETTIKKEWEEAGIDLIDTSRMYESLRYNDYSVENGLGEIVDNSVEAGASRINIYFKKGIYKIGKKEVTVIKQIVVLDNGCGMNQDTLAQCLVLGRSIREMRNGRQGIGKFGVGMILGGISLARRIDVYSRDMFSAPFYHTHIDLEEIKGGMKKIVAPQAEDIPDEYREFFDGDTGTLVILSNCDRMDGSGRRDANEFSATIANFLGRTYRKFIAGGLKIYLDDRPVYLHDPLYIDGPTQFDTKEAQDPKASLYSEISFGWEIPGGNGKTANITIRLSLLPLEWRINIGDGGRQEARKRKIDQNEGVSILRANREVLYDKIPYLIGPKGQAAYQNNDRWWGCEISFPPELDECFQVRYIKRGAEPIGALKDKLKSELTDAIASLRKRIKEDRAQNKANLVQAGKMFTYAETIMTEIDTVLPMNQAGRNLSETEENAKIEEILDASVMEGSGTESERALRREALRNQLYSIVPVRYPAQILFETEMLLGNKVIIQLNVNHPFYQKVIQPLCGDITKEENVEAINEKAKIRDAIMLLLMSFAKAKAGFHETPENQMLFDNLQAQWSAILATAANRLEP